MSKFKVGDRVRVVGTEELRDQEGWTGTVKYPGPGLYQVLIDNDPDGHSGNDLMDTRGYLVDELELLVPKLVPLPNFLDPKDPVDAVLLEIAALNRKKRADYSQGEAIFSNFTEAGAQAGVSPATAIEILIATKQARLKALTANGRTPENESVADTKLDRAVYSVLALAYDREQPA